MCAQWFGMLGRSGLEVCRAARGLASRSVGRVRAVVWHVGQVGCRGAQGCKRPGK